MRLLSNHKLYRQSDNFTVLDVKPKFKVKTNLYLSNFT